MLIAFLLLSASILSVWVNKKPQIWGSLLLLSVIAGMWIGSISWIGLGILALLTLFWVWYTHKPNALLFLLLIAFTLSLKLQLLPGFTSIFITPKFKIGFPMAVVGLLPLALVVPLSRSKEDWIKALKGFLWGLIGIGIMALLATAAKATHWQLKLPSFLGVRAWSNLVLTSIPEEAFYRGFMQAKLCSYFKNRKGGDFFALILTSILFTLAHLYWSPNLMILIFVFVASLLYGGVYLYSRKIESAILTHFCLNLIHMIFFNYHGL